VKKIFTLFIILIIFFTNFSYSQVSKFSITRQKLINQSRILRQHLNDTQDVVLASSMWDACLLAVNQIDAYYAMIGIFNANQAAKNKEAVGYLISWLRRSKNANVSNLKNLANTSQATDEKTVEYMKKLYTYFSELNDYIDEELKKMKELENLLSE